MYLAKFDIFDYFLSWRGKVEGHHGVCICLHNDKGEGPERLL